MAFFGIKELKEVLKTAGVPQHEADRLNPLGVFTKTQERICEGCGKCNPKLVGDRIEAEASEGCLLEPKHP